MTWNLHDRPEGELDNLPTEYLIQRMQGKYLQREFYYDKWGSLGKVLLLDEVCRESGINPAVIPVPEMYALINRAFPRTFACQPSPAVSLPVENIQSCYEEVLHELAQENLQSPVIETIACEEVAERFCTTPDRVRALLR